LRAQVFSRASRTHVNRFFSVRHRPHPLAGHLFGGPLRLSLFQVFYSPFALFHPSPLDTTFLLFFFCSFGFPLSLSRRMLILRVVRLLNFFLCVRKFAFSLVFFSVPLNFSLCKLCTPFGITPARTSGSIHPQIFFLFFSPTENPPLDPRQPFVSLSQILAHCLGFFPFVFFSMCEPPSRPPTHR